MPQWPQRRTDSPNLRERSSPRAYFTVLFLAAVGLALIAAMLTAPLAAMAVAAAGLHFPFPRIFDRTVMVTLLIALVLFAQRLGIVELLREGFRSSGHNLSSALAGLATSLAAFGTLFVLAAVASHFHSSAARLALHPATGASSFGVLVALILRYLPAAILIAVLEEGFFRAFLLGGMQRDFGSVAALILSSVIFAIIHVVRSPARFYLIGFHPAAGMRTLALSASRILDPGQIPLAVGLFLLSLVLGEAFVLTSRVYWSIGLHAGFVFGQKTWRLTIRGQLPRWLAGPGRVPLLAAPAAWLVSAALLIGLSRWLRPLGEGR